MLEHVQARCVRIAVDVVEIDVKTPNKGTGCLKHHSFCIFDETLST